MVGHLSLHNVILCTSSGTLDSGQRLLLYGQLVQIMVLGTKMAETYGHILRGLI